ncbi:MAG: hypothetical protein V1873_00165 [Verrucomicrobiota bacterium]
MDKRRWGPPGWPWELELLALVFVVTAIGVPYYLDSMRTAEPSQLSLMARAEMTQSEQMTTWKDLEGFFWGVVIVGLYLAHLAMAGASLDFMSTPFTHLFSPLVFSMITYYRLFTLTADLNLTTSIVSGSAVEIIVWILGIMVITFLVARIRMARLMLTFRNIDWDLSMPALFDATYAELLIQIRPLIYPPRIFRTCEQGILIEGMFYAMPIPFESVQAVDAVAGAGLTSSGYCLATSLRSMVRIQLAEKTEPILISPKDQNAFVRYCQQHIVRKTPPTRTGETRAGAAKETKDVRIVPPAP